MFPFKNTYVNLPEKFFHKTNPEQFKSPSLMALNKELGLELGIDFSHYSEDQLARIFSGQDLPEGSEPIAQAYAGFQFGHPVPQLGDGRAHLLGEISGNDIQLKGSGRTKFSRRGDGRSALGPVIREYILSEAMHNLGVPTTRALAAVRTGEDVLRQFGPEPGGVFTRVAQSHIRVGTFQYFAFQNDIEGIKTLFEYCLKRHYPSIKGDQSETAIEMLKQLTRRQAKLISQWMGLGFIHGVMNTDNFTLAGITIDYGPCAFMEKYERLKTFSSIDRNGRYAFFNQIPIAQWNILRLADCLIPLIDDDSDKAVELVQNELEPEMGGFETGLWDVFSKKLGFNTVDTETIELSKSFLNILEKNKLDFTLGFRNLSELKEEFQEFYPEKEEIRLFRNRWLKKQPDFDLILKTNPLYIPRNHLVQRAIDESYAGDDRFFERLVCILKNPYTQQKDCETFEKPARPKECVKETFCGT